MPSPLDRETLKAMKRADLQRICKDYGIKANLKTEALIELLADIPQAPSRPPPAPPQRALSIRIASRSATSHRLRGSSTSSVIIHDTDEEDDVTVADSHNSVPPVPSSDTEVAFVPPLRARRAKDIQFKLGVGRPVAAGGSGARAVTRSTSQKGKRGKGSRCVKPTEAAIQEEEEPDPSQPDMPEAGPSGTIHDAPLPEPSTVNVPVQPIPIPDPLMEMGFLPIPPADMSEQLKTYITNLVTPLQTQVRLLQNELQRRSAQEADVTVLSAQLRSLQAEIRALNPQIAIIPQLQNEVVLLKQVVAALTQTSPTMFPAPTEKSLGKTRASDEGSSHTAVAGSEVSHATIAVAQEQAFPGVAQSSLGKRHRDSNDSHITDVVEEGEEYNYSPEDLERRAVRPTKKRPKLSNQDVVPPGPSSRAQSGGTLETPDMDGQPAHRAAFTIFQGPEEPPESYIDPPPPTTHLSDLFPFDGVTGQITPPMNVVGGAIPRPPGADENAPNQMPANFNFNFDASLFNPVTSTPFGMNLPSFTYPEPPTSPTPGAPSGGFIERAGGRIERNDLYQPLRRPQPGETPVPGQSLPTASQVMHSVPPQAQDQLATASTEPERMMTVDPSALMAAPRPSSSVTEALQPGTSGANVAMMHGSDIMSFTRRTVSSTEVGIQLGMSEMLPLPPDTPGAPMKRTMYGTELEGDTRFGDFGVEGVASGFWTGLARRA